MNDEILITTPTYTTINQYKNVLHRMYKGGIDVYKYEGRYFINYGFFLALRPNFQTLEALIYVIEGLYLLRRDEEYQVIVPLDDLMRLQADCIYAFNVVMEEGILPVDLKNEASIYFALTDINEGCRDLFKNP